MFKRDRLGGAGGEDRLSGRLFRTMALAGAASCPATLSGSTIRS